MHTVRLNRSINDKGKAKAVHTARFPYNDFLFQTYEDLTDE